VNPRRIVVIGMSRMLREIVLETISSAPDLEVAREYERPVELSTAIRRDRPDVLVAGADVLDDGEIERALDEAPRLKVLGLADDGRQLLLYELAPQRFELGQASPQRLLELLRGGRSRPSGSEVKGADGCLHL
jgi:hypothetical protein